MYTVRDIRSTDRTAMLKGSHVSQYYKKGNEVIKQYKETQIYPYLYIFCIDTQHRK